jgi:hypothetical protein
MARKPVKTQEVKITIVKGKKNRTGEPYKISVTRHLIDGKYDPPVAAPPVAAPPVAT